MSEDSPQRITKPRIGDIFKIEGTFEPEKDHHGLKVKQILTSNISLISRGEISRPGDFADKLFFINKDHTRQERIKK